MDPRDGASKKIASHPQKGPEFHNPYPVNPGRRHHHIWPLNPKQHLVVRVRLHHHVRQRASFKNLHSVVQLQAPLPQATPPIAATEVQPRQPKNRVTHEKVLQDSELIHTAVFSSVSQVRMVPNTEINLDICHLLIGHIPPSLPPGFIHTSTWLCPFAPAPGQYKMC